MLTNVWVIIKKVFRLKNKKYVYLISKIFEEYFSLLICETTKMLRIGMLTVKMAKIRNEDFPQKMVTFLTSFFSRQVDLFSVKLTCY